MLFISACAGCSAVQGPYEPHLLWLSPCLLCPSEPTSLKEPSCGVFPLCCVDLMLAANHTEAEMAGFVLFGNSGRLYSVATKTKGKAVGEVYTVRKGETVA